MNIDIELFFNKNPRELSLYAAFEEALLERFPETMIKVQKTQISLYNRHGFGAVWLPKGRLKGCPKECIAVTLGLPRRVNHPRLAVVSEPYPGRFTHHFIISDESDIDGEFMSLADEAYRFSESKR